MLRPRATFSKNVIGGTSDPFRKQEFEKRAAEKRLEIMREIMELEARIDQADHEPRKLIIIDELIKYLRKTRPGEIDYKNVKQKIVEAFGKIPNRKRQEFKEIEDKLRDVNEEMSAEKEDSKMFKTLASVKGKFERAKINSPHYLGANITRAEVLTDDDKKQITDTLESIFEGLSPQKAIEKLKRERGNIQLQKHRELLLRTKQHRFKMRSRKRKASRKRKSSKRKASRKRKSSKRKASRKRKSSKRKASRKTSRKRRSAKRKTSRKRRSAKRKTSRKRRSAKRKTSRKRRSVKRKASRKRSRKRRSSKRCPTGCVKKKTAKRSLVKKSRSRKRKPSFFEVIPLKDHYNNVYMKSSDITKYIKDTNKITGDILFVGSDYESRPEYGIFVVDLKHKGKFINTGQEFYHVLSNADSNKEIIQELSNRDKNAVKKLIKWYSRVKKS